MRPEFQCNRCGRIQPAPMKRYWPPMPERTPENQIEVCERCIGELEEDSWLYYLRDWNKDTIHNKKNDSLFYQPLSFPLGKGRYLSSPLGEGRYIWIHEDMIEYGTYKIEGYRIAGADAAPNIGDAIFKQVNSLLCGNPWDRLRWAWEQLRWSFDELVVLGMTAAKSNQSEYKVREKRHRLLRPVLVDSGEIVQEKPMVKEENKMNFEIGKTYKVVEEFHVWFKEGHEVFGSTAVNLVEGNTFKVLKPRSEHWVEAELLRPIHFEAGFSVLRGRQVLVPDTEVNKVQEVL